MQAAALYLDLMKKILTNSIYEDPNAGPWQAPAYARPLRESGQDWPLVAHTMIGLKRLDNLQYCVEQTIADNVPGDLIETGVWRGGAVIFMRAILKAHGVTDRRVLVADSFAGLPEPNPAQFPEDAGDSHHRHAYLAVSLEQVQANFERYGLLDEQVVFLEGWFRDTLPRVPTDRLAVLRLDGDMYESTWDALRHLYPKLSVGGYVIVDDYKVVPGCRAAVAEFRQQQGIVDPIQEIDWAGVYWRRSA
ncbi:MAG: class I SAM-dependent methyltransferase [Candidatus Competibacteraceae bacterium]|nr:class I SAM-dependent methyltransferase [Candidatus Competibacteraceae bacterium]MBK7983784.1 class I SAM-dependent methyltransferase [Candidatus Competibacteraceae bacterium]MBK9950709.1 class I SAM-dependent methyltransferase [Candidatus Competibacteraceae bacterium]